MYFLLLRYFRLICNALFGFGKFFTDEGLCRNLYKVVFSELIHIYMSGLTQLEN